MNILDFFKIRLNEKTLLNPKRAFELANTNIYQGIVFDNLIDSTNQAAIKLIKRQEFYIFENNVYKNIKKLPKTHPVRQQFYTYQTIQHF